MKNICLLGQNSSMNQLRQIFKVTNAVLTGFSLVFLSTLSSLDFMGYHHTFVNFFCYFSAPAPLRCVCMCSGGPNMVPKIRIIAVMQQVLSWHCISSHLKYSEPHKLRYDLTKMTPKKRVSHTKMISKIVPNFVLIDFGVSPCTLRPFWPLRQFDPKIVWGIIFAIWWYGAKEITIARRPRFRKLITTMRKLA